jgi:heme exporter protein CcmD
MLHWFDPGKYAEFVVAAYGVSAAVIGTLVVESLWRARRWRKAAKRGRPAKTAADAKGDGGAPAP